MTVIKRTGVSILILTFLTLSHCGGGAPGSSLGTVGSENDDFTPIPLEDVQGGIYTASYQSPTMGDVDYEASFSFTLVENEDGSIQLTDWSSIHYVSTTDPGGIRCYGGSSSDSGDDLSQDLTSGELSITMSGGSSADVVITSGTAAQVTLTLSDSACENSMTVYTTAVR